jgi:hypothetical protein
LFPILAGNNPSGDRVHPDPNRPFRDLRRMGSIAVTTALTAALLTPMLRADATTASFSEAFTGASLTNSGWTSSKGGGGSGPPVLNPDLTAGNVGVAHAGEFACLTALAPTSEIAAGDGAIVGCPHDRDADPAVTSPLDQVGAGALRLTDNRFAQSSMVLYDQPQQMSDGLDISFDFAMHSGVTCPVTSGGRTGCNPAVTGADG